MLLRQRRIIEAPLIATLMLGNFEIEFAD